MGDILKTTFALTCMFIVYLIFPANIENTLLSISVKSAIGLFVVVYGVLPLIFVFNHKMRQAFVFINMLPRPKTAQLYDVTPSINSFFVKTYSKVENKPLSLGVWHVLPSKYADWETNLTKYVNVAGSEPDKNEAFEKLLSTGDCPIILYSHGNAFNRAVGHRAELYKIFQKLNYHCIAFDYRGYGDSSNIGMSEEGLVEDLIIMYKWIISTVEKHGLKCPNIYLWGHSLGTGVSNHALAELANQNSSIMQPNGLILEAPFNNFKEELEGHILAQIYCWTPWFHLTIINPVLNDGLKFESDHHITNYSAPVLILHAKEDLIVPYKLGVKLLEAAKSGRPSNAGEVVMHSFEKEESLGHKNIYKSAALPGILSQFVSKHLQKC